MMADISMDEAPHFISLRSVRDGLPSGDSVHVLTPGKEPAAAPSREADATAKPRFIPLNRSQLVPVRTRQNMPIAAPLSQRFQPAARPILAAPIKARTPSPTLNASSASPTLDLFDSKRAPLPASMNFYKALRESSAVDPRSMR